MGGSTRSGGGSSFLARRPRSGQRKEERKRGKSALIARKSAKKLNHELFEVVHQGNDSFSPLLKKFLVMERVSRDIEAVDRRSQRGAEAKGRRQKEQLIISTIENRLRRRRSPSKGSENLREIDSDTSEI